MIATRTLERHQFGLTQRQVEVLELVAKRRTLKQVAAELSISESAVNQHVKALKQNLGVNSLPELAEAHQGLAENCAEKPCRKPASIKSGLPHSPEFEPVSAADDLKPVATFHDALTYRLEPPWMDRSEPKVVPGVLEGTHAELARMTYVVGVAIGLLAVVLLGLGVAQGITMALSQGPSPGL